MRKQSLKYGLQLYWGASTVQHPDGLKLNKDICPLCDGEYIKVADHNGAFR
jgi:hypothetical protein